VISRSAIIKIDWTYATTLVARMCLSTIFLISGLGKLLSPAATIAEIQAAGLPFPELGLGLAAGIELLGGTAVLTGFKLRWAAGILAAFTVVTAIFFHSSFADPNQLMHFLKNVAIAGGLLHVTVATRETGG
jgi:putative oxidoreductase